VEGLVESGYMKEGMLQVIQHAFDELGLHRLEANIQPGNLASIGLARSTGFEYEGFSPRFLKIKGEWCDHERWAVLSDSD
jgi:ribosomal-protein-alanine N-acetyltransferase